MIFVADLRKLVIQPALRHIDLYSQSAENLLLGTHLVESVIYGITHLAQLRGPALGIYQMEPATYETVVRYAVHERKRYPKAAALLESSPPEALVWDLRLATVAARMHYRRDKLPLPLAGDVAGLARYWKRVWNTAAGDGITSRFEARYRQFERGP